MSAAVLKKVQTKFKASILDSHSRLGNETVIVKPEALRDVCTFLRTDDKLKFDMLSDVTAVDYLNRQPRFEVVYHFYSTALRHRLRIRVPLDEKSVEVDSISDLFKSALWGEREVFDMYGVVFRGHPDLRRILMYPEFEGHPLRKDYPIQRSQPRMELRRRERDAVEEFKQLYVKP